MPNWKCSSEERGRRYATYLKPGTLFRKVADEVVSFAMDVTVLSWRQYVQNLLPHAQRLTANFMSACLADNHDAHEDPDSENGKEDVK